MLHNNLIWGTERLLIASINLDRHNVFLYSFFSPFAWGFRNKIIDVPSFIIGNNKIDVLTIKRPMNKSGIKT